MMIENLVRENIRNLKSFSSARSEFTGHADVWLDANENPYENGVNRYPDPFQHELKVALSADRNVPSNQIFIGNGSDEIIDLLIRVFCIPGKDSIAYMSPSFTMYQVMADANDVRRYPIPLNEEFDIDVNLFFRSKVDEAKIIFLCSPNNPVGNLLTRERVLEVVERSKGIVVVDEAYIDFASDPSLVNQLSSYDNLVILQTLSKAYGAAGLRIGVCLASPMVVTYLNKIKTPYNVGTLAQKEAIKVLQNRDERANQIKEIIGERMRLTDRLSTLNSVTKVYPSETNFLLVRFHDEQSIMTKLLKQGIVVRDRSKERGCEGCLRITVGQRTENDQLLNALR